MARPTAKETTAAEQSVLSRSPKGGHMRPKAGLWVEAPGSARRLRENVDDSLPCGVCGKEQARQGPRGKDRRLE